MNTVHLIGAEEVARAGYVMREAAESMARSAMLIEQSSERLTAALAEHAARIEAAIANSHGAGGR